jgi:diadenosine tetraphosphate (Ap4A) HIT family hydrolase
MLETTCEFCIEISSPRKSRFYKLFSQFNLETRILLEDRDNIAIPGLGALAEGYVIVLPKKHYISLSYLPEGELAQFDSFKQAAVSLVSGVSMSLS